MPFRSDIIDVIRSAEIMFCPFTEPHCLGAIIEAAAIGIPTVAADIPGPNELVIHNQTDDVPSIVGG